MVRFPDVHHVAGVVVFQPDVAAVGRRQAQVIHGVLGGEERGGEIVIAVGR